MAVVVGQAAGAPGAARLLPAAAGGAGLDRLVTLAARLLSAGSAEVSLLTGVETVAAAAGPAARAAPGTTALDESLGAVVAGLGRPLAISDARADARVAALPQVVGGAVVSYLGVPLRSAAGDVVGTLSVSATEPRAWTPYDLALLEELSGAVLAELELAALSAEYASSRARWDLALEAAGLGTFSWDVATERIDGDERMQALFGYAPGEYVPQLTEAFRRVHPADRPLLDAAIADAVDRCGDYRVEFRVVLPDGRQRWLAARGQVSRGPHDASAWLVGTCHDITDVRTYRDEAAQLLETMATGFLSMDRAWRVTYLNAAGARVVGYTAAELVGEDLWQAFPGLADADFGGHYRQAVRTGAAVEFEAYYDHLQRWYEVRAVPRDTGLDLYFLDVSARRAAQDRAHTAREQAQAAMGRLELVARVSAELAATALDTDAAVDRLAELLVPVLGEWAVVTLVDAEGAATHVGTAHVDPQQAPVLQSFARRRLADLTPYGALSQARVSADVVVWPHGTTERAVAELRSPDAVAEMRALAPEWVVVLPLVARGRARGTVSLLGRAPRPVLDEQELLLAGQVAAQAGLALDNAQLYAQQRSLAEGLQLSLLTEPPEPDHCEIVVRYAPAAQSASVGGDWFDSFVQADGATTVVIGDVVGHDTQAAAAMGQLRSLLRGIAWHSGDGPGRVLAGVDAAMAGLQVTATATAVVGRLEQTAEELAEGVTRFRWSNAGHPPPMVLHPGGTVTVLDGPAPDLLLGIDAATARQEHVVTLPRGSTVLLYTDGLMERRGEDLDVGLARLRAALVELAPLPLSELCDELLRRLVVRAADDVALLAVRLHGQDGRPPAEAGPERVPRVCGEAPAG